MKQNKRRFAINIEDPQEKISQFYDPFQRQAAQQFKKQAERRKVVDYKCCMTLFGQDSEDRHGNSGVNDSWNNINEPPSEVDLDVRKPIHLNQNIRLPFGLKKRNKQSNIEKYNILTKIITNTRTQRRTAKLPNMAHNQNQEYFGFNTNYRLAYPQTPGFKSLLQSPFGKFNYLFKDTITTLSKQNQPQPDNKRDNYQSVDMRANPLSFYNQNKMTFNGAKYFMGIALGLKQLNKINQCFYFCTLACYSEPFNERPWRKFVSLLQEQGKLNQACVLAKTSFLFTQSEDLVKAFFVNGQKCGYPLFRLQGIICSIANPQVFEKTILSQSAKLQIKHGKCWKGIKVLFEICNINEYKLSVCVTVLFLARFLQNSGYLDQAISLLKQSFSKSMSKLEVYLLFLEMSVRKHAYVIESDLQQILKYLDCISGENRYKLLLHISQLLYKFKDQRCYWFLSSAFRSATQLCAPGAGVGKAIRQIYFQAAKFLKAKPLISPQMGDQATFEVNRYRYINGQPLIQYEFSDWKYFLHYGVGKKHQLLGQASRKWPHTGRIIAQWIHCLRQSKSPLTMLKIWRQKIQQVPKSGELWCQGGRIYAQLGEYWNASKCFKCAIHFTPQYGDSFIEELRLLLKDCRFVEIHKLKKNFLVCEPFYGHVLSYLKLNNWQAYSHNFNQIWENAVFQISQDLYKQNVHESNNQTFRIFTAIPSYNQAYLHADSHETRQRLFASYEQMENKN